MAIPGLTAGSRIWNRCVRIKMNNIVVAEHLSGKLGHRIEFQVVRHNRMEPNECTVRIYGLNREKRQAITGAFDKARKAIILAGGVGSIGDLEVEAGYDGVLERLTKCDILKIEHEPVSPGWVTIVTAADGIIPYQNAFVNESLGPGVNVDIATKLIASSMQIAFFDASAEAVFKEQLAAFTQTQVTGGFVLQGPSREVLTELLESLKLNWSLQDGKLVLTRFDGVTTDKAVLLSPTTGLQTFRQMEMGRARAGARLIPKLTPGRQVSVVDEKGKPQGAGIFRIDRTEWTGDTEGGPFDSVCDLSPAKLL